MFLSSATIALITVLRICVAQKVQNSWPQNYTGIPSGAFTPQWQNCACKSLAPLQSQLSRISPDFEVTDPLPNVTEALPRSFAGSISTNSVGHANDTLFFWGFEKEEGS